MAPSDMPDKSLPTLAAELWDLLRTYVRQATVDPIKGLGRFVALGTAGSVLLGIGTVVVAIGVLRLLQSETGSTFAGNWSWAPYAITLVACAVVAALALSAATRRKGDR
ncbi:MAG: hypothetical protein ACRDZ9_01155 [Acidimicrobiales bacterium]